MACALVPALDPMREIRLELEHRGIATQVQAMTKRGTPSALTEFVESPCSHGFRESAHAREHIAKIWGAPLTSRVSVDHAIE